MKNELFNDLIQACLKKNLALFLSVLTDDSCYNEPYGPQDVGKLECQVWFEKWFIVQGIKSIHRLFKCCWRKMKLLCLLGFLHMNMKIM